MLHINYISIKVKKLNIKIFFNAHSCTSSGFGNACHMATGISGRGNNWVDLSDWSKGWKLCAESRNDLMPKDISPHHHQGNVNGDSTHYELGQDDPGPVEQFPIHPSPPEFLPLAQTQERSWISPSSSQRGRQLISDKVGSESKRICTHYFRTKIIKRWPESVMSKKMKSMVSVLHSRGEREKLHI